MYTFKDYLKEMSIAGYGDWTPSKEMIGTITEFIINKKWTFVDDIDLKGTEYKIYKQGIEYILGNFITSTEGKVEFEVDFRIKLTEHKSIQYSFKFNKSLVNVDGVKVKETSQGYGIATFMYKYLVHKENFIILGDEIQYFGARKLWARLSKSLDVVVDIVDIDKSIFIEKNVTLTHGNYDHEFDERVYDYDDSKKDIRLILKDIK